jgi:hypothetical protein
LTFAPQARWGKTQKTGITGTGMNRMSARSIRPELLPGGLGGWSISICLKPGPGFSFHAQWAPITDSR